MPTPIDVSPGLTAQAHDDPADADPGASGALLFARVLDGKGGGRPIAWADAPGWTPGAKGEVLWLHLDRTSPDTAAFLREGLGVPEVTIEVLTSNETRPRVYLEGGGLVTILRGVNMNPGAQPEDMIAMQIWADAGRVVSLRRRPLQSPRDVLGMLDAGRGPATSGDLVTELIEQMVAKMSPTIVDINELIDDLEDMESGRDSRATLAEIAKIRRYCLALKRYMTPQHDALLQLLKTPPAWMTDANRRDIHETIEKLRRYLDDLDVSKESALVLQDDLNNRAADQTNRTMYMLSLVAAIFLPLGFLTGLLGVNVGGIPGANASDGFWVTVALLAAVFVAQLLIFRRLKWF